MKKYLKLAIGVAVFLVFIFGAGLLYKRLYGQYNDDRLPTYATQYDMDNETADTSLKMAKDFTVYDASGNEVTLYSLLGKPVVVNFWASWCSPCKSEFPDFQKAYEQYGSEITFVMVNLTDGSRETKNKAQTFLSGNGYTLPVYYDLKQNAAYAYNIYSIPTTYFLTADGHIVTTVQGMLSAKALQTNIDKIRK
jgi:thiol-disulfide isomerase/thioredoxin